MVEQQQKPRFLDLLKIRLPITGVASFAHRVTGVLLFLALPGLLYLLGLSLTGEAGFSRVVGIVHAPGFRLALVLLLWIFLHHLLAGLRYLLIDLDIGVEMRTARRSALAVSGLALLLALLGGSLL